jgi:hypothetical protein
MKKKGGHAVGQFQFIEVDDQPQRDVEQLHAAQQLSLIDGMDVGNGFDLNEQASVDQQLQPFLTGRSS